MTTLTPDETILGLIAIQSCHGYELIETFRNASELGDIWKMSTSQIYSVLKRLEKQQLIHGQMIESENAPSRTEYRLTPAGNRQLEAWLQEPDPSASIRRIRVEFLSRLYIARQLNIPTLPIVYRQRAACEAAREHMLEQLATKQPGMGHLATELVIAQLEAVLQWIQRCGLAPQNIENLED